MRNPYEVLGVRRDADPDVIAAAYRALMRKHHPDARGDEGRAKEINEAYCILSDPELRRAFDAGADREQSQPDTHALEGKKQAGHRKRATLIVALAAGLAYVVWSETTQRATPETVSINGPVTSTSPSPEASGSPSLNLSPQDARSAPASLKRFPVAFRGEWNQDLAACGTGLHDSRLIITDTLIRYYESRGGIHVLQQPSPREVSGYVSLTGEGEGPWLASLYLRLSEDGTSLADADGVVRQRCPSQAAEDRQ